MDNIVGRHFSSKNFGDFLVKGKADDNLFTVEFVKTKYTTNTSLNKIKNGTVRDRFVPTLYGVGFLGDEVTSDSSGKMLKEYQLWTNMLERCYCEKYHARKPTYKDCSVSDFFKNYSNFKKWCNQQVGFNVKGYSLDKDILVKGNKIYSESTCAFVPKDINNLLTKRESRHGDLPIGVVRCRDSSNYASKCVANGKNVHLGHYKNIECAFLAYKNFKEKHIKDLAKKLQHAVDARVLSSLLKYEVSISD